MQGILLQLFLCNETQYDGGRDPQAHSDKMDCGLMEAVRLADVHECQGQRMMKCHEGDDDSTTFVL